MGLAGTLPRMEDFSANRLISRWLTGNSDGRRSIGQTASNSPEDFLCVENRAVPNESRVHFPRDPQFRDVVQDRTLVRMQDYPRQALGKFLLLEMPEEVSEHHPGYVTLERILVQIGDRGDVKQVAYGLGSLRVMAPGPRLEPRGEGLQARLPGRIVDVPRRRDRRDRALVRRQASVVERVDQRGGDRRHRLA